MTGMPTLIDRHALVDNLENTRKKSGLSRLDAWVRATEKNAFTVIGQKKFQMDNLVQVSLRVWTKRGIGIATTSDLSESGLTAAAMSARDLGLITDSPDYEFSDSFPGSCIVQSDSLESLCHPSRMQDALLTALDAAAARHSEISLPYCETSQRVVQRMYATSSGQHHFAAGVFGSAYFQARTESKSHIPRTGYRQRSVRNWDAIDHKDLASGAVDYAQFRSRFRKIDTGTYPVVFSPHAFLALLGGFSSMLSGQAVAEHQSLLTRDDIGSTMAPPELSVSDLPLDPRNPSPVWFSGEGLATERTEIITNGQLNTFLNSRLSARLLGARPTGHGSFAAKPSCSPYFLSVAAGKGGSFGNVRHIYIDRLQALHAGISARQGSFSLPIEGRIIENGEEVSIEAAVVAGDVRTLLKDIAWIGTEINLEENGLSPKIGISGLKVTGRS